jgi:DNA-binding transcriptional regulator GbsR (MarR family)
MHLYFSAEPQSLDDLAERLHISKGSASMAVRQLEAWGALRQVWIKGDRKDYYQTTEEFGRIIRKALQDLIGRHMESADRLLGESDAQLGNGKARPRPTRTCSSSASGWRACARSASARRACGRAPSSACS